MKTWFPAAAALLLFALCYVPPAGAHANNVQGVPLTEAQRALDKGDVKPLLKWVKGREAEEAITRAFNQALALRRQGPEIGKSADMRFYEIFMTEHRKSFSYMGSGPFERIEAENEVRKVTRMADEVAVSGGVDRLTDYLSREIIEAVRKRYADLVEKAKHKDDSLEAGNAYIEAYLELSHYSEHLTDEAPVRSPRVER